jgi:mRNA interferase RelE/StbE
LGIYVCLTEDACSDLLKYRASGRFKEFLAKLVRLEEEGVEVGLPLRDQLTSYRKIVVGDRDWRIIYQANRDGTEATVWVIGDRGDEACYKTAVKRLEAIGDKKPLTRSLAATLLQIAEDRRRGR